jgi:hypothetical protein
MSLTCYNKKTIEVIIKNLHEPLELNKESHLDEHEEKIVNDLASKLASIFKDNNHTFDKNGFKHLVKVLYGKSFIVGGGDEVVEYQGRRQTVGKYDLFALLGFLASILLLYLAYVQLNNLLETTLQTNAVELGNEIKDKFIDAKKNLEGEEMAFLTYIFKVFSNFGCNMINSSTTKVIGIINDVINKSTGEVANEIANVCYKGSGSKGVFGYVHGFFNYIVEGNASGSCALNMGAINADAILQQKGIAIRKLVEVVKVNSSQISNLLTTGARFGYASIGYFMYRIHQARTMRIGNSTPQHSIEYIDGGRKKSKKTKSRKNKKQRKTRKC